MNGSGGVKTISVIVVTVGPSIERLIELGVRSPYIEPLYQNGTDHFRGRDDKKSVQKLLKFRLVIDTPTHE